MKIGIDCRLWNESGVGRYIRNLVKNLQIIDKKNDYILFALGNNCEEINFKIQSSPASTSEAGRAKFKVVKADIRWHSIEEQIRFPSIINKENLDLIHFPYFSVPIFYNRAYVVTIHDLIIHHYSTGRASTLPAFLYWIKNIVYRVNINITADRAKKIIVPSQFVKDDLVKSLLVDPGKIEVTAEGFDYSDKSGEISEEIKRLAGKTKYMLFVGNAYPHKNLDRLINAFLLFTDNEKYKEVKLFLVGKKDYFYKKLKEKNINNDSIVFLHDVNDDSLFYLYQHAIFLIAPSLMEGFGLTVLEAMANSCIVAASDIPSFNEICHDACIYFNPKELRNMMETMQSVLNLDIETIARYKKLGVERASLFSWRRMAKQTLDIYEGCIGIRQGE